MKIALKIVMSMAILLLSSCFFDSDEDSPAVSLGIVAGGSTSYLGGTVRLVAHFDQPVAESSILWRTGKSEVLEHNYEYQDGMVVKDTIDVEWVNLPYLKIDTTEIDSVTTQLDSSYWDTLSVRSPGLGESGKIVFEMLNFLSKPDTLTINGVRTGLDGRVINIASNRGGLVNFNLNLSDMLMTENSPVFDIDDTLGIRIISTSDSVAKFQWIAPNVLLDDTVELRLTDSRGGGLTKYYIHRLTYDETGSVYLAGENRLSKFSMKGQHIWSRDDFNEISDVAIHPTRNMVWVADRGDGALVRLDRTGKLLFRDSANFSLPNSIDLDVESDVIYVSDMVNGINGRLRGFSISNPDYLKQIKAIVGDTSHYVDSLIVADTASFSDTLITQILTPDTTARDTIIVFDTTATKTDTTITSTTTFSYTVDTLVTSDTVFVDSVEVTYDTTITEHADFSGTQGPISKIVIDQYKPSRMWYVIPESDYIIQVTGESRDTIALNMNRPSFIDFDPQTSKLWIGDSTSLVRIDTLGTLETRITGFSHIGGIAASGGRVCVSDARTDHVYGFDGAIGSSTLSSAAGLSTSFDLTGFSKPIGVAMSLQDNSCWVADRESGNVFAVATSGALFRDFRGFEQPTVIRVHQGVE